MSRLVESRTVSITIDEHQIHGDLSVPHSAIGVAIFAHGSGSSRNSSRNRFVATKLIESHMATLLIDLLTIEEETVDLMTTHLRFDIAMLADRLAGATDWIRSHESVSRLPIGYFGSSTGAAAALVAAAKRPALVTAVVSRGGRPDLAGAWLPSVQAPTLLIVGERDEVVVELNRQAAQEMRVDTRIEIVPEATHLFEEPGALQQVASLAGRWLADKFTHRKAAA